MRGSAGWGTFTYMLDLLSLDEYTTTNAPAGAVVRQRHQPLHDVLHLESGTVAFGVREEGRLRYLLGVMEAPCWLDAAPALAGQPCAVDMVAQTPVRLRTVPVEQLRTQLQEWPPQAQGLVQSMAQGYCQQAALTVSRVAQDAVARCAQWLLQHAEPDEGGLMVQLAQSKRQIAAHLGIAPETLSRVLRQLRDQGLLDGLGKTLRLPQPESLRQLAKA
jgi:CRP-like cAMP-binding protein